MIRFEEVDWAVCAGVYDDKLILSARSSLRDAEAGELLRSVVGRMGKAGGHDRRAGGCIKLASTSRCDRRAAKRTCAAGCSSLSRSTSAAVNGSSSSAKYSKTCSRKSQVRARSVSEGSRTKPSLTLRARKSYEFSHRPRLCNSADAAASFACLFHAELSSAAAAE